MTPRRTSHVLIRSADGCVLVTDGRDGGLPIIHLPATHRWWRESRLVARALADQLGIRGSVLRVADVRGEECGKRSAVFAIEVDGADQPAPPGTVWTADGATERAGPPPERDLMPWERAGWFADASRWITALLGAAGRPVTGPIEQIRNHGFLSSILRAPTAAGAAWIKASPPMHRQETALTEMMAKRFPDVVPAFVASDPERGWILLEEAPGGRLDGVPDRAVYLDLWKGLLRRMAEIQIELSEETDTLLDAGVPDWRPERLARAMEERLEEMETDLTRWSGQAFEGDAPGVAVAAARARLPRWREAAVELAGIGPAPSLHHGDFHSANILSDGAQTRVIDWAFQAGIAHPFFFLSVVLEELRDPTERAAAVGAYLEPWRAGHSEERLQRAMALMPPVAAFHAAMGHHWQLKHARHPWEGVPEAQNAVWYLNQAVKLTV